MQDKMYNCLVNLQDGSLLPKARLTFPGDFQALGVEFGKAGSILREKIWSQMVLPLHMARMKEAQRLSRLTWRRIRWVFSPNIVVIVNI